MNSHKQHLMGGCLNDVEIHGGSLVEKLKILFYSSKIKLFGNCLSLCCLEGELPSQQRREKHTEP